MPELPTGTVTFMFTDIEGSTKLLRELGPRFAGVRDEHHTIVREAIAANAGTELGTEGDSFFAVFRQAKSAVDAAVTVQRNLASHAWPDGVVVRVRIGLHTGEGVLSGDDYVGMDVHLAARIASAANGGEVIVSETTRALVEHALPEGSRLRDLGEHRLKDIEHPQHLYDVVIDGLLSEFPPPRTLDARPNNLPVQLTSFVGREAQVDDIRQLLARTRLLTLTGPGGTGKTRLALEVAQRELTAYADGGFFVDLSPVADPQLVPAVIARSVSVGEVPGVPILETLKTELGAKQLLLILDNFEQVTDAAPAVEELLTAGPKLKALITSRFVLSLHGEQEYSIPPLELPGRNGSGDSVSVEALSRFEAVRLFAERAAAVQPSFRLNAENAPAVAEIASRLDGLPLAIELAASRSKVLAPQQMLSRLRESLSVLASRSQTAPERQRTLRGAIAWSYDLLEEREQRLFRRLSVFSSGWTLQTAEAVVEPHAIGLDDVLEGVSSLVDKSLVHTPGSHAAETRFSMLETLREFGHEELTARGELDEARRRHGEYFLRFALEAEPHLTAADQAQWLETCEVERDNLRTALRWAVDAGEAELGQAAAGALWRYWQQRGHLGEGRRWLDELLAMSAGAGLTAGRARALTGAGGIAWWQNDHPAARAFYDEAVLIERALGDRVRTAEALYNDAFAVFAAGEDAQATELLEESLQLFRQAGAEHGVARALAVLVVSDAQLGRWPEVLTRLEEVVAIWRRLGDHLQLAMDLIWLGFARGRVGDAQAAREAALEALTLYCDARNATGIALALRDLEFLSLWDGRPEDTLRFAAAGRAIRERIGGGPPQGFGGMLEGDPAGEARAQLAPEVADRAWAEGQAMDEDAAVAFARSRGAAN